MPRVRTTPEIDQAVIKNPNFDPRSVQAAKRREKSRLELWKWRTHLAMRDEIILEAIAAGLTDTEICEISGVARTTIMRIVASSHA